MSEPEANALLKVNRTRAALLSGSKSEDEGLGSGMKDCAQLKLCFVKLRGREAIHAQLNHVRDFACARNRVAKLSGALDANRNTDSRSCLLYLRVSVALWLILLRGEKLV